MTSRRLVLVLVTSAALALAACSSSTAGVGTTGAAVARNGSASASPPASGSPGTGTSSGSAAPAPTAAASPEALAALLQQGLASTQSAHIHLSVATAGQTITGDGDEKLVGGKLSALTLTETIPGAGTLQLIQIGGKTYAKLPSSLNTSGKPWVLISTSSTNPTIKALAGSLASSQSSASVGNAGVFAQAASSISNRGKTTVGGVNATHYSVVVDTSKLPSDYPGKSALVQAGIQTLPVELYVDGQGRPVQVTENLTVSGASVATAFTVTDYNKPVTITAPPADQVSTD